MLFKCNTMECVNDGDRVAVSVDKVAGGANLLSAPVVTDTNGKKLSLKRDYKIVGYYVGATLFDGKTLNGAPVPAGTEVTVKLEGVGNYKGKLETTYRITTYDISKMQIKAGKLSYDGGAVEFTADDIAAGNLIITNRATGKNLVYGASPATRTTIRLVAQP